MTASNDVRMKEGGEVINATCYTKFGQLNDQGVIFKEKEIRWFQVDPSRDWAYDNFFTQVTQISAILRTMYPMTDDPATDKWALVFSKILEQEGVQETEDAVRDAIKDKTVCLSLMKTIGDTYALLVDAYLKDNKAPVVSLKLVYEKTGTHLQQPKAGKFISTIVDDPELKVTDKELMFKAVGENTQTPAVKASLI